MRCRGTGAGSGARETPAILVVGDDPASREPAADILHACGYAVSAVEDGRAARTHLASHPCDLILADMRMPVLDGMGLLRALGRRRGPPPVIVATAYPSMDEAVEAVRAGARGCVPKPARPGPLRHLAAKAPEEEQQRRAVRALEDATERAVALADGDTIRPEHLPPLVRGGACVTYGGAKGNSLPPPAGSGACALPAKGTLAELVDQAIHRALAETGGNRRAAARLLGIPERTFYRKLKSLDVTRDDGTAATAAPGRDPSIPARMA